MLIRCPECRFERRIDDESIPQNAVVATCPRCKCRFHFRTEDGTPAEAGEQSQTAQTPAPSPQSTAAARPQPAENTSAGDDPLPPGAIVPHIPDVNTTEAEPEKQSAAGPAAAEREDQPSEQPAQTGQAAGGLRDIFRKARHKFVGEDAEAGDAGIPWEQPEKYSALPGLYRTILQVMFNAPRFFTGLGAGKGNLARPLAFYILIGLFQTLVDRMWYLSSLEAAAPSITDPKLQELIGDMAQNFSLPMTIILSPGILAIQLFFLSGVFYLMLRLVHPNTASFKTVFRVIAYSAAPTVICIIPMIGSMTGSIWFAVNCFMGCKCALRLPWVRVALALGPLYLVAFGIGMQLLRQIASLT